MKRLLGVLAATGLVSSALFVGCSEQSACMPAPLAVHPGAAHAGQTVTVSAPAADCDLGYDAGKTYKLTLVAIRSGGDRLHSTEVGVGRDGSFTAEVTVPTDFLTGQAQIVVDDSPYDNCPAGASCVGYAVPLTVLR